MLTYSNLCNQYRLDSEFRSSLQCFSYFLAISLVLIWLPYFLCLPISAICFYILYNKTTKLGLKHAFTMQAAFLGWTTGSSALLFFILNRPSFSTFFAYSFILSVFHFSEFVFTAITNRRSLQPDSFLLNHSHAYWIAAISSWFEFFLEAYYVPAVKGGWVCFLGFLLCCLGEFIRKSAMVQAGVGFTHKLAMRKREDHVLVVTGVYAWMRHPGYCGWFLWSVGTQLILCNPFCALAYAYVSWKFFHDRIFEEERDLIQFFGQDYMEYQDKVCSGVPFVTGYLLTT
ncbi:unnamed protein product [Auanema sp. JU1783]|nr:unnamed protein product [Auanema sp. JU1783]